MMEILTTLAYAECENCGEKIANYIGHMSRDSYWSHIPSKGKAGTTYCDGAPIAIPKEGTTITTQVERSEEARP